MPTIATGQSRVRPSSRRDLVEQVLDVVADAPGAVGAEVREVLADLGRVDPGQLGQPLRGDRRRPGARRSRAGPGSRAAGGRPSPRGSGVAAVSPTRRPPCVLRSGSDVTELGRPTCSQGTDLVTAFSKCGARSTAYARPPMVAGLAFLATAIATVFAQATGGALVRGRKRPTRAPGPSPSRCSPWPRPRSRPAARPAGTRARSGSSTCSARCSTCRGSRSAPSTCSSARRIGNRVRAGAARVHRASRSA